ncbi:MAG TPA: phosphate signaling complex protein PhoU [Burkholderiales bacterium]|nr:phosphate signaling complex protein PhoU [Burkholderiales bacterium]
MVTDHTSKDFDQALGRARQLVGLMAARVERQLADAIESLQTGSPALIAQILRHEAEVNGLERAIDEFSGQIIARRHPAARDLRLVMSLLGATTDLERVGDEAKKIALYARSIFSTGRPVLPRVLELRPMADLVYDMLRQATRAIDALDPNAAAALVRRDLEVNASFRAVLARLAGFMVEDPRSISACLDILFVAKSLERIGDHAKNLGEHVVYAAMGKDVRHATAQEIEKVLRS